MKVLYAKRLLALALIVTVTLPAVAQDKKATSFVEKVAVSDQAVTFHTEGNYVGFTMQVAGPDEFYLQQRFKGDETPVLRVKNKKNKLADGTYTIQITAQPMLTEKMKKSLQQARAENDRAMIHKAMQEAGLDNRAMTHSLSLGIAEGRFLDPDAPAVDEEVQTGALQIDDGDFGPRVPDIFRTLTPVRLSDPGAEMTEGDSGPAATVAPADVTATTLDQALQPFLGDEVLPAFVTNSPNPDIWKRAYFKNVVDGQEILFHGYMRPVKGSGEQTIYLAYFQQADEEGQGFGVWVQGLFQRDGEGFRFLDHVGTQQAAAVPPQPKLFDYMTEEGGQSDHSGHAHAATGEGMDILHLDDVIIDFSLCVGNDCVNGESFGFDTIRLKENNLRIDFLDTSNSASFPQNDWEITINDSTNGGADFFAVTDASANRQVFRLTAGAPANSLFMNSSGNIGVGTSTPVVEVHVRDGDSPTVRLEQDGSSGFTPQTWDLAGNETNFFIRDVTNGSRLPFRIRPSAATSSIDINDGLVEINGDGSNVDFVVRGDVGASSTTLFVDADAQGGEGGVGIGTDTPGIDLNITNDNPQLRWTTGNVRLFAAIALAGATEGHFELRDVSDGNTARIRLRAATSATNPGVVQIPGDLDVGGTVSKGGGSFKIDHPLDPENKYLYHSFVESPDMMNVYNGNIVLDGNGRAVVEMPAYFEALNKDFRYQLTAVGAPGPNLYIARQIDGNRFEVAGGTPGMTVSWQVTGVRQDPFAELNRIQVEVDKPEAHRGFYLHSQAYNQPITRSIEYQSGEQAREDLQKLQAQQSQRDR